MGHKLVHSEANLHSYQICGKLFTRLSDLHKVLHAGERPYRHKVCDQTYAFCSGLSSHKHIHTSNKPYPYQVCGKCFITKSYLQVMNVHCKRRSHIRVKYVMHCS